MPAYGLRISDWSSDVCSSDLTELADSLVVRAAKDVHQVRDAEALAAAVHAAQRLLCGHGGVPGFGRRQAVVAVAAGLAGALGGVFLAEARKQHLAAAAHRLAVADQCVELAPLQALSLFAGLGVLDHLLEQHHVAQALSKPGVGRFAGAAGTAGFLVVAP